MIITSNNCLEASDGGVLVVLGVETTESTLVTLVSTFVLIGFALYLVLYAAEVGKVLNDDSLDDGVMNLSIRFGIQSQLVQLGGNLFDVGGELSLDLVDGGEDSGANDLLDFGLNFPKVADDFLDRGDGTVSTYFSLEPVDDVVDDLDKLTSLVDGDLSELLVVTSDSLELSSDLLSEDFGLFGEIFDGLTLESIFHAIVFAGEFVVVLTSKTIFVVVLVVFAGISVFVWAVLTSISVFVFILTSVFVIIFAIFFISISVRLVLAGVSVFAIVLTSISIFVVVFAVFFITVSVGAGLAVISVSIRAVLISISVSVGSVAGEGFVSIRTVQTRVCVFIIVWVVLFYVSVSISVGAGIAWVSILAIVLLSISVSIAVFLYMGLVLAFISVFVSILVVFSRESVLSSIFAIVLIVFAGESVFLSVGVSVLAIILVVFAGESIFLSIGVSVFAIVLVVFARISIFLSIGVVLTFISVFAIVLVVFAGESVFLSIGISVFAIILVVFARVSVFLSIGVVLTFISVFAVVLVEFARVTVWAVLASISVTLSVLSESVGVFTVVLTRVSVLLSILVVVAVLGNALDLHLNVLDSIQEITEYALDDDVEVTLRYLLGVVYQFFDLSSSSLDVAFQFILELVDVGEGGVTYGLPESLLNFTKVVDDLLYDGFATILLLFQLGNNVFDDLSELTGLNGDDFLSLLGVKSRALEGSR